MAKAGRITGKDLYATFGGTVLSGDFTSVTVAEEGELVDLAAGSETFRYQLFTRSTGTVELQAWFNSATGGSAERAMVDPGDSGTLIIGPAGTASGKPKWTCTDVIVASRRMEYPFNAGASMRVTFNLNADWTESAY